MAIYCRRSSAGDSGVLFLCHAVFLSGWERIKAFLNPFHDPLGSGWQISQSLTAVGSGGFAGLGLGASKQKLFFLPEASSDFIFAVIGEELGLIGNMPGGIAFLFFFYRGMRISLAVAGPFWLLSRTRHHAHGRTAGIHQHIDGAGHDADQGNCAALHKPGRKFSSAESGRNGSSAESVASQKTG